MLAWANDIIIYWWFLLIHELYSFNTWIISKVQSWINHQLLGNGKKSEAVGVRVNFKENLKQLLFRHLKNNKFKVKIAGRVKPEKLKQHFNATSCNIVKSSWEMLCGSWPNARNTLQHTKFWLFSNLIQLVATCCYEVAKLVQHVTRNNVAGYCVWPRLYALVTKAAKFVTAQLVVVICLRHDLQGSS